MAVRCVLGCGHSHLPTEVCGKDTEAGLARGGIARAVVKEAAVTGQAFVKDGRVLRAEEVLASPAESGFDRAAYQKAYMREYMRRWRRRTAQYAAAPPAPRERSEHGTDTQ